MIYINAIHLVAGQQHEHIVSVRWTEPSTGKSGEWTVAEMVRWIDEKNGDARVSNGRDEARVAVVHAVPPYLRTLADGKWTNNLLALPKF